LTEHARLSREQRLEGIALAAPEVLIDLADAVLEELDVALTRGPLVGLLAVRVEEPFERVRFNFTEVTVSEAEVAVEGRRGYAMVLGRAPEKALAGAILDAALECGHADAPLIEAELRTALANEDARLRAAWARVAPTRVAFEEMAP
jgi:alpha-D-ribose 1-methylphosphonate 5-triphosphate synthase subunit PhnG